MLHRRSGIAVTYLVVDLLAVEGLSTMTPGERVGWVKTNNPDYWRHGSS